MCTFAIITPAYNEAEFIHHTARAMVAQTIRPIKWIVVNDGSTDRTEDVIRRYASQFDFIKIVNVSRVAGRDFARKIMAFNQGLAELAGVDYQYIGNVDADITFEPHYFERILRLFESDPGLGIAGGIVYTKVGDRFLTGDKTLDSVAGAVQLFRRRCFEDIGGYIPLEYGGVDAAAEITARMKGWKVRKSTKDRVLEHRRTGTAERGILSSKIREGRRFYSLGYGPVFYMFRCIYRLKYRPYVLGSAAALAGYFYSMLLRRQRVLPGEVVHYLRVEHRIKLKRAFSRIAPFLSAHSEGDSELKPVTGEGKPSDGGTT